LFHRSVEEVSHIAFKENFDLAQASCEFSTFAFHLIPAGRVQYNEAVLMANGKFKALFAQ
jgi:hypothetical protein